MTLLLAGYSQAQQPVPAPPVAAGGLGQPMVKQVVDPNTVIKENIELPMLTGDMMAMVYRKWTGKRVIITQAVQAKSISFLQPGPLTYREAADLLVKTAFQEGLVFVPSGPNEVKLLLAPNVRKAGGYKLITDPLLLPDTEELVTYLMPLQNIKPEDALRIFTSVVAQLNPHGAIVPVPNASALIITENSALIKTLVDLKNRIDVPQELSMRKMITLEYGDSDDVAEKVISIMEFSAKQNTRVSVSPGATVINNNAAKAAAGNNAAANGARKAGGESFSNVQVISEPRTNRIFVMGRPIDVEFAEGLVKDFDAPLTRSNYFKHKLNFLTVSEFLPIAEDAINLATNSSGTSSAGGGRSTGGSRNTGTSRNTGGNNNNFGSNNGQGGSSASSLAESSRVEYPESQLIGKTLLVADNINNTLIIQGPPQSINVVKDLIKEMDVASEQVQITAIFGRYNIGDALDFGVDFARTYQKTRGAESGFAGQNRTGYPLLVDPRTLTGVDQFADVAGLSLYGNIGKHFNATLRAMESNGKFHLLARPTVFTTNNRKATLSSGQQIAVPTDTFTQGGSGSNGSQSTNIAYRDVLLELEVIPLVNSKEEVTLQISFVNNNIVGSTNIDGNEIPTIGQERILTTVTVPNGETIILGGLITERDEKNVSGIPILQSIPGLGNLFKTTRKEVVREELVIFIQPRIVNGKVELMKLQELNQQNSQLARDIQGEGVLPMKEVGAKGTSVEGAPAPQRKAMRPRGYRPW